MEKKPFKKERIELYMGGVKGNSKKPTELKLKLITSPSMKSNFSPSLFIAKSPSMKKRFLQTDNLGINLQKANLNKYLKNENSNANCLNPNSTQKEVIPPLTCKLTRKRDNLLNFLNNETTKLCEKSVDKNIPVRKTKINLRNF